MSMPHPYEADGGELLDYQTEQEDPPEPVQPIEPVPVHICEPVVTVPTIPHHITCKTFILDTGTPWTQLLPQDPLRVRARIITITNGIVLCHSAMQAQDPNNLTDQTFAAPNGALLTSGLTVEISGTQAMWIATSKFPTRVGLITERRSA